MKKSLLILACLAALLPGIARADVGDTLSYCGNSALSTRIGVNDQVTTIYWGIMLPTTMLTGRDSVMGVLMYITTSDAGSYTLHLYQGGTTAPQTHVYSKTYTLSPTTNGYVHLALDSSVYLNNSQNLWVIIENTNTLYPASACEYTNNTNSNWLSIDGSSWLHANTTVGLPSDYSWMIKCITHTSTSSAPSINVTGPSEVAVGVPATFTAAATSGATITWTLNGATPSSATGQTATATWNTAGNYNVVATATNANGSSNYSLPITVVDCGLVNTFPFTMGFEDNESLVCWTLLDADEDGHNWGTVNGSSAHTGTRCIASASYDDNTLTPLAPDNWLISPQIYLPDGNNFQLSWYVTGVDPDYYDEHYGVFVSTSGTDPDDFTMVAQYDIDSVGWAHKTVNLNNYAGDTIYFAIRHFNSEDVFYMLIDDIELTMQQPGTYSVRFVCEGNVVGDIDITADSHNSLCGETITASSETPTTLYITVQPYEFHIEHLYVNGVDHVADLTTHSSTTKKYTFTPVEPTVVRAVFLGETVTITTHASPEIGGTVTGGGTCHIFDTITLTATPASTWYFTQWQDGNTENPRQIVVSGNATYTAQFAQSGGIDNPNGSVAEVRLVPNPATDATVLTLSGMNGEVEVTVIDLNGRTVASRSLNCDGDCQLRLDLATLPAGDYFVRVQSEGNSFVKKLIVK